MRMTILAMIATTALLAACSTAPKSTGTAISTSDKAIDAAGDAARNPVHGDAMSSFRQVGDRIYFATDESTITPESQTILTAQAAWLRQNPAVTVTIEGHCDERGTRDYNLALGQRRADAVRRTLIALGVAPGRIDTISYGKERPAVAGSAETAWAQNRRAVTTVN